MKAHEDPPGPEGTVCMHRHTHTHTPFMVARGLLPMRAWFIAVLTPIIVFLKHGRAANSHKHTRAFTHAEKQLVKRYKPSAADLKHSVSGLVFYGVTEAACRTFAQHLPFSLWVCIPLLVHMSGCVCARKELQSNWCCSSLTHHPQLNDTDFCAICRNVQCVSGDVKLNTFLLQVVES